MAEELNKTEEIKPLERYSYSKISTYHQCPMKFKIHYLDKNYLFSSSIATEFGTLTHECEEQIALALQAGQPINYTPLKNKFIIGCRKHRVTPCGLLHHIVVGGI